MAPIAAEAIARVFEVTSFVLYNCVLCPREVSIEPTESAEGPWKLISANSNGGTLSPLYLDCVSFVLY